MSRFLWLVRREVWEHKAIWVAPLIVLGCLALGTLFSSLPLGPDIEIDGVAPLARAARRVAAGLVVIGYAGLTIAVFVVMGIISFFYSLDSLYADRRDRSVLFWKSLPLTDAETVLSKFAVALHPDPVGGAGRRRAGAASGRGAAARAARDGRHVGRCAVAPGSRDRRRRSRVPVVA